MVKIGRTVSHTYQVVWEKLLSQFPPHVLVVVGPEEARVVHVSYQPRVLVLNLDFRWEMRKETKRSPNAGTM